MFSKEILEYCYKLSDNDNPLLKDLKNETYKDIHGSQMLSESVVSSFLSFLVKVLNAQKILDIGTFTGYSCLNMLNASNGKAKIITIDRESQTSLKLAKKYFSQNEFKDNITLLEGDAKIIIPKIEDILNCQEKFDLVFIDADKSSTLKYYEMILPKLKKGGAIVVDDVLWKEKVILKDFGNDKRAKHLNDFNYFVKQDKRVFSMILSIGDDGIHLIYKL